MRTLGLACLFVIGVATGVAATQFSDVDQARELIAELRALQSTRDLQASDVTGIAFQIATEKKSYVVVLNPSDQGWNSLLSGLNTMVVNKIATLKTQLQALEITNVPN